jgi:serine/threonine protein kinase
MMTENQDARCPTCDSEMVSKEGRTFCPACLLQQGMQPSTFSGSAALQNWSPPTIEQLTETFPHLQIESLLGQGGMGAVYKVQQKELDRPAALKVLPDVAGHDPGFTERFLREARLLASLSHPHIVTVYEFGQRDGVYFLLMEYIDGVTLRQASQADPIKRLSPKEALAVVGQLCDALQFAHDEGVVHRDIKPENILIDKRGRVKIADFGLAKLLGKPADLPTLTRTHQLMGTPAYMAPEQIEGHPVIDHRADIYSLGVVFYELLTGELPLGRFQPPSQKADLDARLDEVVLRTLEKAPERRYQHASQVRTDMDAIRSPAVSGAGRAKRWTVVRPLLYVLAGVVLTLVSTRYAFMAEGILRFGESDPLEMLTGTDREPIADNVSVAPQMQPSHDAMAIQGGAQFEESYGGGFGRGGVGESAMAGSSAGMAPGGMSELGSMTQLDEEGQPLSGMMGASSAVIQEQRPLLEFADDKVTLRSNVGTFTADTREQVNQILSDFHQQYLLLEADHSLIRVQDDGSVETTVYCFTHKWQRMEDELWTRLDDCLNVDQQRELRQWLPVTGERLSGGMGGMGGFFAGGSSMGGGGSYEGGMSSPVSGLGLLGWTQPAATKGIHHQILQTVRITRKGRWFQCSLGDGEQTMAFPSAPSIPPELTRFDHEPGPHIALANANVAFHMEKWDALLRCFTARCVVRWAVESNARLQIAGLSDETLGDQRSSDELGQLILHKTYIAMPPAYHDQAEQSSSEGGSPRRHQLVHDYGKTSDTARQAEILDELESLEFYDRMFFLFETFSMFSVVDTIEFPVHDVDVSKINQTQTSATAVIEHSDGGQSTVTLVLDGEDWKIDQMDINWESIGLPESISEPSEETPEPVAVETSTGVPDSPDGNEGAL